MSSVNKHNTETMQVLLNMTIGSEIARPHPVKCTFKGSEVLLSEHVATLMLLE